MILFLLKFPQILHLKWPEQRDTGCFFNWASPEFAKCWPVSNWFQKNVKSPRLAPPLIGKRLSVWRSEYDSNMIPNFGGGRQSKQIWGGQSRGEAQLKKTPCIIVLLKDLYYFVPLVISYLIVGWSYPDGSAEGAQRGNLSQEGGNRIERHS